jgi:hypothetical protein
MSSFASVSQSASKCCPELGWQMQSLLAIKFKRGLFGNLMQTNSWNWANPLKID